MMEFFRSLLSASLTTGSPMETEHALVMLLLLCGLLTYQGNFLRRWPALIIIIGILLAVLTPIHQIDLFWPLITALIIPPFLWQGAVNVTKSGPIETGWMLVIWLGTFSSTAASLILLSGLPLSNALLLSMLAVSLVWFIRELNIERSFLSTIGQISLILLLAEIDIAMTYFRTWLGSLFSGVSLGFVLGFLCILLYRQWYIKAWEIPYFFFWSYLSYGISLLLQVSPIASTLAAALIASAYGFNIGLWKSNKDIPSLTNTPVFLIVSSLVWLILGWQAEAIIIPTSLPGVPAALLILLAGVLITRKIHPRLEYDTWLRLLQKGLSVLLLLTGGILLWPRQAYLTTFSVELALIGSIFLIFLVRETVRPIFDFIGIHLDWPNVEG